MNSSPNLLVLTPWFPAFPGAVDGNFIFEQVIALQRGGCRVSVLVGVPWIPRWLRPILRGHGLPHIFRERYSDFGFQLEVAYYLSWPRYGFGALSGPIMLALLEPAIRRLVMQNRIQLIHAHTETMGYVGVRAASRLGIPCVVTLHGINTLPQLTNSGTKRHQLATTLKRAARVILVGSPLLPYFAQFVNDTRNFLVISNGFNVPRSIAVGTTVPKTQDIRIVSVSNLHANKGVDLTVRAVAALVHNAGHKLELVIVGDGQEQAALRSLARELGVSERVHFTGRLPHSGALAEIAASEIFCLPSWREACGVVYLEAMALGKVTLACRGQGPSDFIQDGLTGYLVEPRSLDSLVQTLNTILANWEAAEKLARVARDDVWRRFTWCHNAEAMVTLYAHLMSGNVNA